VFAAILGGADFDYQLAPMYGQSERAQNVGHFFIAIDPAYSPGGHRNVARAEELIDRLHALRRAPGHDGVRFPGEGAAARARERAGGIPLARAELETAAAECEACGLQPLAERFRRYLVRAS
jgi:LDH2 family malate/lactate/ureidoglycolate dehydrogenase